LSVAKVAHAYFISYVAIHRVLRSLTGRSTVMSVLRNQVRLKTLRPSLRNFGHFSSLSSAPTLARLLYPKTFRLPLKVFLHELMGRTLRMSKSSRCKFDASCRVFSTLTQYSAKNSGYGYQKPDYTRMLDGDHKPILCTQCGLSSGNKRQMLKCDFCDAHWHLDCLDPPLANPPNISLEASQRDAWRCPRHIEHDLRSGLLFQNDLNELDDNTEMVDAAPIARVARKVRKLKNADAIEPTFSRGMRNNGLIDIINDPDDDTDGEGNYVFGQGDSKDLNAKVFRVPERGVILDFVSRVKRYVQLAQRGIINVANILYSDRVAKAYEAHKAAKSTAQRRSSLQHFFARPMQQQQAALNLARLAKKETDIGLGEGNVDALILNLTVRFLLAPLAFVLIIGANSHETVRSS
jgi:hypothetical protein